MIPRSRASVPLNLRRAGEVELTQLKAQCVTSSHWSEPPAEVAEVLSKFKSAIKGHFYDAQNRRCCYCSSELQRHKRTYELEHVLARRDFLPFMFEFKNMGAACVLCNGAKGAKSVLAAAVSTDQIPFASEHYLIVHPHLDEWADHLTVGDFDQIKPLDGSAKGQATIATCGIEKLNWVRLADHFGPDSRKSAENVIKRLAETRDQGVIDEGLSFLEEIANLTGLESARSAVRYLRGYLVPQ